MRELCRVIASAGMTEIHAPHYSHYIEWSATAHVRPFTPLPLRLMSKKQIDEWIIKRVSYFMLGHVIQVDFESTKVAQVYGRYWVVRELQFKLKAVTQSMIYCC